jgi:hypothetical protein
MLKVVVTAILFTMLAFIPMSQARTADGMTPAEETVCDNLNGALFGLCNAYCEAMDCHLDRPFASERACERVLTNYMTHSGGEMPPCHGFTEDGDDGAGDSGDPGAEDDDGNGFPQDEEAGDTDSSDQPQS